MSVPLIDHRTAVFNAITTAKAANQYTYNNFDLDWTYVPISTLEELSPNGKVWVVGLDSDEAPPSTRGAKASKKEVPIQLAIQRSVGLTDKTTINTMITLVDQLRETVRLIDPGIYQWLRTEAMKDEEGTPFSFMGLREGIFEAYFTAYFLVIRQ